MDTLSLNTADTSLGWMSPAAIIALGLTWREAIYCIILGLSITAIPLVMNGAIGMSTSSMAQRLRVLTLHRCTSACALPDCRTIELRIHLRQVCSSYSNDHGPILACHSDLYRLYGAYTDDPSNLAIISRHPQPPPRVCWYYVSATTQSLPILVNPVSNPTYSTTQAEVVLLLQGDRHSHSQRGSSHRHVFKSWRHRRYLESRISRLRL